MADGCMDLVVGARCGGLRGRFLMWLCYARCGAMCCVQVLPSSRCGGRRCLPASRWAVTHWV